VAVTAGSSGRRDAFGSRIAELVKSSGMSLRDLGRASGVNFRTIGGWVSGRHLPQQDAQLLAVVRACVPEAMRIGTAKAGWRDEAGWVTALNAARQPDATASPRNHRTPGSGVGHRTKARPPSGPTTSVSIASLDPHELGVHVALRRHDGAASMERPVLTPYWPRSHDQALRSVIASVTAGGRSCFVVLTGSPGTGKTRALYEALTSDRGLGGWVMYRPADTEELATLLQGRRITPGSLVWLDEAQRFLSGSAGSKVAVGLSRLLQDTANVILAGAMWNTYWDELTKRPPGDPAALGRELLTGFGTRRIRVPDKMDPDELRALEVRTGPDGSLAAALAASAHDGQVFQHLIGGPELLDGYLHGGLLTPVERALVTAALYARQAGHRAPLPAALLIGAADGYLTRAERPGVPDWAETALSAITLGIRPDGTRTDVGHTVTALIACRDQIGQAIPYYEPGDFLARHSRASVGECIGTCQIWDAASAHTVDADDLHRLGRSAYTRGLYRRAAGFWYGATVRGNPLAAGDLIDLIASADPAAVPDAVQWAMTRADLGEAVYVLRRLNAAGQMGASATLAAHMAAHTDVTSVRRIVRILMVMMEAGFNDQAATLAMRAANNASIDAAADANDLLSMLRENGFRDAAMAALARLDMACVRFDSGSAACLLGELSELGAEEAARSLAERTAVESGLTRHGEVLNLLNTLRESGFKRAARTLAVRAAAEAELAFASGVSLLIAGLLDAGYKHAARALAQRAATAPGLANQNQGSTLWFLRDLHKFGYDDLARSRAERTAADAHIANPFTAASLLTELRSAGADDAARALASRIATETGFTPMAEPGRPDVISSTGVGELLHAMSGFEDEARIFALRIAEHSGFKTAEVTARVLNALHAIGLNKLVRDLARRAVVDVDLTPAGGVGHLVQVLRDADAHDAMTALLARDPAATIEFGYPRPVVMLMDVLASVGATHTIHALAQRAILSAGLIGSDTDAWISLLRAMCRHGAEDAARTLTTHAAAMVGLRNPYDVASVLAVLRESDASDAIRILLDRNPASEVQLRSASAVAGLMSVLCDLGARDATRVLAMRAATDAAFGFILKDGLGAEFLLSMTDKVDGSAARTLARQIADITDLDWAYPGLLETMRRVGAQDAAITLLRRKADAGIEHSSFEAFVRATAQLGTAVHLLRFGREVDYSPANAWSWPDLMLAGE
jgi:hypothetical protein